ncbi:ferredoxin [Paenibacillus sp. JZ16]|uniref:ferredoxin n=1 Tax=Paenibacillus sp. JZ16 TaxID=1906272 RepID=UPI00188C34DC|nr:ferredoxin [Paenibacillus sp. JZ16]
MAKYALVEKATCIACGACGEAAPDIFDFNTDGFAEVVFDGDGNRGATAIEKVELIQDLIDAQDGCPTDSIKVSDQPFC